MQTRVLPILLSCFGILYKSLLRLMPATALLISGQLHAGLIITATENGNDVEFTWSGSLDTTGVSFAGFGITSLPGEIRPSTGWFLGYSPAGSTIDLTFPILTPTPQPFGTSTSAFASSFSGDPFGLDELGRIGLPAGYSSGSALSGSISFTNTNFDDLGITAGSAPIIWALPSTDTITLSAVPEPSTYAAIAFGVLGIGLILKRRRDALSRVFGFR